MKWLISGGCGFIGRNGVRKLVAEGKHAIRITDNRSLGLGDDLAASPFTHLHSSQVVAKRLPATPGPPIHILIVDDYSVPAELLAVMCAARPVVVCGDGDSQTAAIVRSSDWRSSRL